MPLSIRRFQQLVLSWFKHHGRKNLPWQKNKTPYRVWLSEIMLQQTQVATVIPYFERFLSRFPNLTSLAHATEDQVLHLWSGLGYYSRARNLYRTAQIIKQEFNGIFPANVAQLQQLPGIGRSTASAIVASAFNKKATILDGNVKRLLARFHAICSPIDNRQTQEQLWQFAEEYTPSRQIADYTQAMMDLGAIICTRKNPKCTACPLITDCQAYQQNLVAELPLKKNRRVLPIRMTNFLILMYQDTVLLQKRPTKSIWGGLWSFLELPKNPSLKEIRAFCFKQVQVYPKKIDPLPSFRHHFTHFHLDIFPIQLQLNKPLKDLDSHNQIWYSLRYPEVIGIPAPVQMLLEKLSGNLSSV